MQSLSEMITVLAVLVSEAVPDLSQEDICALVSTDDLVALLAGRPDSRLTAETPAFRAILAYLPLDRYHDGTVAVGPDETVRLFGKLLELGGEQALSHFHTRLMLFAALGQVRNRTASAMGRKGGQARTKAKIDAVRANGRKGGRPRKRKETP